MVTTSAAAVQSKLIDCLACPVTRGPVEVLPLITAAGAIRDAILYSPLAGAVVGHIREYQIDFVRYRADLDLDTLRERIRQGSLPADIPEQAVRRLFAPDADLFYYEGDWGPLAGMMVSEGTVPSTVRWRLSGPCRVLFNGHPWSGHAEVLVDGHVVHTIDLYEPHTAVPRSVTVQPATNGVASEVTVRATGVRSDESMGQQCIFNGCEIETEATEPSRYEKRATVRGADFLPLFYDMLSAVPVSGLCLDMGGGNRQIDDERYVNLDYAPYDEPDIIGDGLNLPFADNTFDLVYSSGVIEHLRDPLRAGREIHRVTKPGGRALIGMAFMQPIHAEGQHFFNATIWGLEEAFKDFTIDEVFWTGSLSFLTDWMMQCVGVDRTGDPEDVRQLRDILSRLDQLIPYDRLKHIASSVWIVGTKARSSSYAAVGVG